MFRAALVGLLTAGSAWAADSAATSAAKAINAFGVDLLHDGGRDGNTVFSPYSIQIALGMAAAGAAGQTRAQMEKTLHYSGPDMNASFAAISGLLDEVAKRSVELSQPVGPGAKAGDPITLNLANRLYGQKGFPFRPPFLALMRDQYHAPLEVVDFAADPPAVVQKINQWVADQTHNRIRDLIPPSGLTARTRLVLVDAIYLKAPWQDVFEKGSTKPLPFYLTGGKPVSMPTMSREGGFGYAKRDGFEAIAIPYVGDELQFLILLPSPTESLATLQGGLNPRLLSEMANLPSARLDLFLPRFKMEPPSIDLSVALGQLGMDDAFDPGTADFDGIAPAKGPGGLYISHVFHKAFLSIDEQGTEAAAATAVVMEMRAMAITQPVPEVHVDRPFLFAVQEKSTGACLFLGRVVDPR